MTREHFARAFGAITLVLALLVGVPAAKACNTTLLTDKNGNLVFPICPPNQATPAPGTLDNTTIGATKAAPAFFTTTSVQQGTPATLNATGTLTAAQLATGIVTSTTAAAVAATLPLGTAMDTANPLAVVNTSFDFSVIATGANAVTMTTNTGWTLIGTMVVATVTSGHFRAVKTGVGTWTLYRIS